MSCTRLQLFITATINNPSHPPGHPPPNCHYPHVSLLPEIVELQVEVGEATEAVSQSAHALTQLAVVLPSHAALFGQGACHAMQQESLSAARSAGQHSRACQDTSSPSQPQVQGVASAVSTCLWGNKLCSFHAW